MAGRDTVAELAVNLTLETAAFSSGAGVAEARAKTMEGRLDRLGGAAAGAGKQVAGMAGAFALGLGSAAIAGVGAAAMASLDYASSLGETAQQLGVTTAELQKYRYAASQTGVEQSTMDASLAKLTKNLGLAASGNKAMAKNFSDLGISLKNADGSFKTAGQALPEIAEKLKGVANPAERAAILTKLFGKSGQALMPLLSEGAKGVDELTSSAEKLGIVLSEEQIAKADEAADKLSAYKQVFLSFSAIGTVGLIDYLGQVGDEISKFGAALDAGAAASNAAVADLVTSIKIGFGNIGNAARTMVTTFSALPGQVGSALSRMAAQVTQWLTGRMTAAFESIKNRVKDVGDAFHNLYIRVVGNSDVPDMVNEVGDWFAKLDAKMVKPTHTATKSAGDAFEAYGDRVKSMIDRLFPELQALKDLQQDLADIESERKAGRISEEFAYEARRRASGIEEEKPTTIAGTDFSDQVLDFGDDVDKLSEHFKTLGSGAMSLADKWEQAGYAVVDIIQGLFGNSKGGRVLGSIISGGIEIFKAFKAFGGARAMGGPVTPGKKYLVGEKGPELVSFGKRGYVHPNGTSFPQAGGGRLQIVPSPYFDVVVDSRASNVAAPMAGRAAMTGAAGGMAAVARQRRRAIP